MSKLEFFVALALAALAQSGKGMYVVIQRLYYVDRRIATTRSEH